MSTYVIGDVHGCLQSLLLLLKDIDYQPQQDVLWFTGDLVNRGPDSLGTLDFIMGLPDSTRTVLGNHDLSLMVTHAGYRDIKPDDTFDDILSSPNANEYIAWLRKQPLLHEESSYDVLLTHAGILPAWDRSEAKQLNNEIVAWLTGPEYNPFLQHLFGNTPTHWDSSLTGWERARLIVNAFTRMRYCTPEGDLSFESNASPSTNSKEQQWIPWFEVKHRKTINEKILFGHWASLNGKTHTPNIFALDTGCVWGGKLSALCLDTGKRYSVRGHHG